MGNLSGLYADIILPIRRLDVRQHREQRPKDRRYYKPCWHPDQRTASDLILSARTVGLTVSKIPYRFRCTNHCTNPARPICPRRSTQYPRGPKRPDRARRPRGIAGLDRRRSSWRRSRRRGMGSPRLCCSSVRPSGS